MVAVRSQRLAQPGLSGSGQVTRSTLAYLAPLAGRGRIALAIRVRGYRSINQHYFRGDSPSPQPSPRKSGAREYTAGRFRESPKRGMRCGMPQPLTRIVDQLKREPSRTG